MKKIIVEKDKDGYLRDTNDNPIYKFWTGKPYTLSDLIAGCIGTQVDHIISNHQKNLLKPLKERCKKYNFSKYQLPSAQQAILARLWTAEKPMTVGVLAKTLSIANSNLTPELNKMEEQGYIYRETSKTNRRFTYVFLDKKGVDVMVEYHTVADEEWENLLKEKLTEEELLDMYKTMLKYNNYLNKIGTSEIVYQAPSEENLKDNPTSNDFEVLFPIVDNASIRNSLKQDYKSSYPTEYGEDFVLKLKED